MASPPSSTLPLFVSRIEYDEESDVYMVIAVYDLSAEEQQQVRQLLPSSKTVLFTSVPQLESCGPCPWCGTELLDGTQCDCRP